MIFTMPLPTVLVCVSMVSLAASPFALLRAVMITDEAPRLTKWTAVARPSPPEAPVMRMLWSLNEPGGGRKGTANLLW